MTNAEVSIVESCRSSGASFRGLVVIAHRNSVRNAVREKRGNRIFQPAQRAPGIAPLDGVSPVVAVLYAVAKLDDISNIACCQIVKHPLRL